MVPVRKHISAAIDDEVVEIVKMAQPALVTRRTRHHICFAPAEQAYNHGSDRLRPLRTTPFDLETWIGDFDHLSDRVWPHPSYNELLARFLTSDPRFPLPDTIAKDERLQNLRLRCCGESCCSPTSQSPFVEYEKPSRLEKLSFELVGDVIIYPFYVRLSKETKLQKLFAIVHRQENGEYHFWKADGDYHESYGLSKGNVSLFKSPRSAHSTNIGIWGSAERGLSAREVALSRQKGGVDLDDPDDVPLKLMQKARSLVVGGGLDKQVMSGQDEASSKLHSKKRPLVDPIDSMRKRHQSGTKVCSKTSTTSKTVSKQLVSGTLSKTPLGQLGQITNKTQKPDHSLMHVKGICMLAYHLTGEGFSLQYRTNCFTIEFGQEPLINPINGLSFKMTKTHAPYVLFSRQSSFKVILSQSTTHDINETDDDITGGIILLEFDGVVARDDFMARIREMVGGSAGGISSADDFVIETMYGKLTQQLNSRRSARSDSQKITGPTVRESIENLTTTVLEGTRNSEGDKTVSCPAVMIKSSPSHAPRTPVDLSVPGYPTTPVSNGPLPGHRSTETVSSANDPSPVATVPTTALAPSNKTNLFSTEADGSSNEAAMKKALSSLLHDTYIKYPSAQDDDEVEIMALLLKAPLIAGDMARVRELRMELKVYLIAHHG
ncbi:hypothetical protein D6D01_01560 [Aureobasidium pullulans]|uniref:Uncharacterized protein n=1 Tax=Aureobasidium pullulans TaxID=5580 RepID=A0A4S9LYP4_AURPU|nr:hypothetical protein D6D01_01560 [Aureobasidium pullulans]